MSRLLNIKELGQSVWLDNLSRPLLSTGALKKLIDEDGVCGITSNPAIFNKAMTEGDAYDDQIKTLAEGGKSSEQIYEALAIKDIQDAADVLRPVYAATQGKDGYVSLEVSPHLANDTKGTLQEAKRLWNWVNRPNLMIKIPGTPEGIPAIKDALVQGINVNVTLLFSLSAYGKVMDAYLKAMELRLKEGKPLERIASVASFFISRIDVNIDKKLDEIAQNEEKKELAQSLRGKIAIANAKLAYQLWKSKFSGERWNKLESAGARVQRPLWASTSTKDPSYKDVLYVEPLIGPETVNTMPDETVDAFRDHGEAANAVEKGLKESQDSMNQLKELDIDMKAVTEELVVEGVDKFIKPFDALLENLEEKRQKIVSS